MATVIPQAARGSRSRELVLLLFALGLSLFAYVQIALATTGEPPTDLLKYGGGTAVMALAFHGLMRWRAPYADPIILPVVVLLNGTGLAMIHRLDHAYEVRGLSAGNADRQLMWTAIAVVAAVCVLVFLRDHRTLRRYTYTAMVGALVLLLLPMLPVIGREINGARVWIGIGSFVSFQPGELAKLLLAIFFAGYLVANRDNLALAGPKVLGLPLPRLRHVGPILLAWGATLAVLVFQRDLGAALLFFGLFVAMLYVATERLSWIIIGLSLFAAGAVVAARSFSHVAARFDVWLNALDPDVYTRAGGSYQVVQGIFGMSAGGLMGTGWGQGRPDIPPYAHSDFIVASLGEELGLTGLLAILVLYLILVERGIRAAIGVRDGFGKLLATGLSFALAFQVFVVVGGITRLIPLTGLVMPFLAQGGSALLVNWMIAALLLRISDAARRPAPVVSDGVTPLAGPADDSPTQVVKLS